MLSPAWAKVLFTVISLGGAGGVLSSVVLGSLESGKKVRKESCSEWKNRKKTINDPFMCIEVIDREN